MLGRSRRADSSQPRASMASWCHGVAAPRAALPPRHDACVTAPRAALRLLGFCRRSSSRGTSWRGRVCWPRCPTSPCPSANVNTADSAATPFSFPFPFRHAPGHPTQARTRGTAPFGKPVEPEAGDTTVTGGGTRRGQGARSIYNDIKQQNEGSLDCNHDLREPSRTRRPFPLCRVLSPECLLLRAQRTAAISDH